MQLYLNYHHRAFVFTWVRIPAKLNAHSDVSEHPFRLNLNIASERPLASTNSGFELAVKPTKWR